jgi:hypothetical protein
VVPILTDADMKEVGGKWIVAWTATHLDRFRPEGWTDVVCADRMQAATLARDAFEGWLADPDNPILLANAKAGLRGYNLGCYCRLGYPCHADVLLRLVNEN